MPKLAAAAVPPDEELPFARECARELLAAADLRDAGGGRQLDGHRRRLRHVCICAVTELATRVQPACEQLPSLREDERVRTAACMQSTSDANHTQRCFHCYYYLLYRYYRII